MSIPASLQGKLALPVIASPMFIVSNPELVIAQCLNGIVGSFPALNARPQALLGEWLTQIKSALGQAKEADPNRVIAPFAVNQIVHQSNTRLEEDVAVCVQHQVPIIITSLRAPDQVVPHVHSYGGLVFHDVISVRHAEKALEAGVDGLILVCAGAGGHAGTLSPFALVNEVRRFYDGPIALSGAISHGRSILSAQALGADFAYMGTRFIATTEANASETYKNALLEAAADDIVYTPYFTGVAGNYLKSSIVAAGLDPDNLPHKDKTSMNFGSSEAKAWRDVWGAGQGVGSMDKVMPTADVIAQLKDEYLTAAQSLDRASAPFRG
ncbi:MAG TPA: nitronate monooxygenase family protein [Rhodocyclaceae bacterium]|nr:nitronate monooxygenase family protein [Rhodocyclaceae bacterium]